LSRDNSCNGCDDDDDDDDGGGCGDDDGGGDDDDDDDDDDADDEYDIVYDYADDVVNLIPLTTMMTVTTIKKCDNFISKANLEAFLLQHLNRFAVPTRKSLAPFAAWPVVVQLMCKSVRYVLKKGDVASVKSGIGGEVCARERAAPAPR